MTEYGARTVADFCASVGIGKTFFYREVKEGRLKVVRAGRTTLVRHEDGQEWLKNLPAAFQPETRERARRQAHARIKAAREAASHA